MNIPADGELLAILAAIPDPRGRKGRRHSLAAMLAATICGLLTGATGCTAIAQWIRNQEPEFWHAIGFTRRPPTKNCYRKLLLRLPAKTLEAAVRQWAGALIEVSPDQLRCVSLDGKTLCGTLQPHGQSIHLLGLLDHASGGVLGQLKMPPTTNEHKAAMTLLKSVDLNRAVITGDAMFCQRKLCQQIIDSGGDYLFTVKDKADVVAGILIDEAIKTIFPEYFPKIEKLEHKNATGPYDELISWFFEGAGFELLDDYTDAEYKRALDSIPPLNQLIKKYYPEASKADSYFFKELLLWGLVSYKKLSRHRFSEGFQFKDLYGSFISGL